MRIRTNSVQVAMLLACVGCSGAGTRPGDNVEPGDRAIIEDPELRLAGAHPWCLPEELPEGQELLITSDSLGPVAVEMRQEELRRACPAIRDTISHDAEGNASSASVLRFFGTDLGVAEWTSAGELARIAISDQRVRTKNGLGVGSTMGDLRRQFETLSAGYDDAGVYVWSEEERRLSYLLRFQVSALLLSPDDVSDRSEVIPDSARVRLLLLDAKE